MKERREGKTVAPESVNLELKVQLGARWMLVGRRRGELTLTWPAVAHVPHANPALRMIQIWGWGPKTGQLRALSSPLSAAHLPTLLFLYSPTGCVNEGVRAPHKRLAPKPCLFPPPNCSQGEGLGRVVKGVLMGFLAPDPGAEN